ncbi:MAG: helix-turn-helix transcriptional regulator [Rhodospirillaceae bacterium]|nr:helix-turn-helix transcriptional regulator [Rhodospirillaceae bacterium]MDE0000910.1 helix-turn-helix transcriptional regulator [Rhodospirillaceae bacterium]MDE0360850.1 helix-turn-helix transcriptional regulator [Rhodospirillaceae bacterium]
MRSQKKLTPRVASALREIGDGIRIARRRQRARQVDLAKRMGVSVATVQSLESGNPGVSMGTLAMAMLALGMMPRFEKLADPLDDVIGLSLDLDALPERVRVSKKAP